MGKRYSDVFTKTGYGAFKALYPVFFLSPGCSPVLGKIRTSFCELPAAYANALRRGLPASTTTAFATMIRNKTSYTMSTGVRFGLSHPYHIFLGYFESFV